MRLALVQTHADDDAASNLARALVLLDQAAKEGADVAVLPELFLGPYFPQSQDPEAFDRAGPVPGPTSKALSAKAKEHGMVVVATLFEKRAKGVYHNTAVVLDADGSLAGTYRKMHIPHDPRFEEKFYFTPGDAEQGFGVFDTQAGRLGVLVCWDQWYPEAARSVALAGADVVVVPTTIGTWQGEKDWQATQQDMWRTVQRGHAIANGCYWTAVNRVGTEGELDFWGGSFVAGPDGRILLECGKDDEVAVLSLDLDRVEQTRRGWPFLRDRRVDAYGDLTQRVRD